MSKHRKEDNEEVSGARSGSGFRNDKSDSFSHAGDASGKEIPGSFPGSATDAGSASPGEDVSGAEFASGGESASGADGAGNPDAGAVLAAEREKRISELELELSGLKDQYLRKLADSENFRKRMAREKEEDLKYANTQLLVDLVGVLDDFDRGVRSSELARDFQALHDGVVMIRDRLLSMLEGKYGLLRFESVGSAFDPNLHEAVMSAKGETAEPVVVEEYMKGYKLRERVVRTAKVKVLMPGDEEVPADGSAR